MQEQQRHQRPPSHQRAAPWGKCTGPSPDLWERVSAPSCLAGRLRSHYPACRPSSSAVHSSGLLRPRCCAVLTRVQHATIRILTVQGCRPFHAAKYSSSRYPKIHLAACRDDTSAGVYPKTQGSNSRAWRRAGALGGPGQRRNTLSLQVGRRRGDGHRKLGQQQEWAGDLHQLALRQRQY